MFIYWILPNAFKSAQVSLKLRAFKVDPLTSERAIVSFFISQLLFCSSKFRKKTSPKHPQPISFFTWSLLHSKSRMSHTATRAFCLEALATGMVQTLRRLFCQNQIKKKEENLPCPNTEVRAFDSLDRLVWRAAGPATP